MKACCGGVMLSPSDANRMIGEWMARRSKARPSDHSASPCREVVADEQVLDDPLDLLPVHQEEAAPPALELQEALRLGVDLGEEV